METQSHHGAGPKVSYRALIDINYITSIIKQIFLCTDASDYAIGTCLWQKKSHVVQPIRFLSKILTPHFNNR